MFTSLVNRPGAIRFPAACCRNASSMHSTACFILTVSISLSVRMRNAMEKLFLLNPGGEGNGLFWTFQRKEWASASDKKPKTRARTSRHEPLTEPVSVQTQGAVLKQRAYRRPVRWDVFATPPCRISCSESSRERASRRKRTAIGGHRKVLVADVGKVGVTFDQTNSAALTRFATERRACGDRSFDWLRERPPPPGVFSQSAGQSGGSSRPRAGVHSGPSANTQRFGGRLVPDPNKQRTNKGVRTL